MSAQALTAESIFASIQPAPPDPILGLTEAFNADARPGKVNLGVGVYQNGNGKVPVLSSVRDAEKRWYEKEESKTYLPIDGAPAYNKLVQKLLLGEDSPLIAAGRAATVQGLGGTGALRIGGDFLANVCGIKEIWISTPSWENHRAVFTSAGLEVKEYPYFDSETHAANFPAMIAALRALPGGSAVLLHACCHNPTGADLTDSQWDEVVAVSKENGLIPFLDFAYQGFGVGIEEDAYAVRAFAGAEIPVLIANSFSKSFSLYRERVGALTVLTASAAESKTILSQIKRVIRSNYSNPASHGAQVVTTVLSDPELRANWVQELTEMRERIHKMRSTLLDTLQSAGVDFSFIVAQKGMFSYSGLTKAQVHRLRDENGIYIVDSGRICVAALNDNNVGYVAQSILAVL